MIGPTQVAIMQPGTVLVNTARAALIDGRAVLAAAKTGAIRVLTDVFPSEPLPLDDVWRRAPGVTATPHIAALTRETLNAQGAQSVDEIERFLSSAPLAGEILEGDYDHIA
jgi:phosphoglycerate dehydrogenase-like enzyme